MARQRRTFDEQIADLVTAGRNGRSGILSVPAMDALNGDMIEQDAIQAEHVAAGALALRHLDQDMQDRLAAVNDNEAAIGEAAARLEQTKTRLDSLFGDVATIPASIEAAREQAVRASRQAIDLAVAKGQSLVINGDFEAGLEGWSTTYPVSQVEVTPLAARGTGKGLRVTASTANVWPANQWVPTSTGRTYYLEMWVRRTGAETATYRPVGFVASSKSATGTSTPIGNGMLPNGKVATAGDIPTDAFVKITSQMTIAQADATAVRFAPWVLKSTNVYDIDDVLVVDITEAVAAQATADNAASLAGTAQAAADSALTMAGSKSRIFYSTGNATGVANVGDTWRKTDSAQNVIAEWRYVGGATPWQTQKITSDVISNLDVGKLTAGTAVINDAVARNIAAQAGQFIQADIGNLVVTGNANMDTAVADRVFANLFATRRLSANQVVIGSAGNLLMDPNFEDAAGWSTTAAGVSIGGGRNGNNARLIPASTAQSGSYYGSGDRTKQFRVTGGASYRVSVYVKAASSIPAQGIRVYMKWTNPSTAASGVFATPSYVSNTAAIAANTWGLIEGLLPVDEAATQAIFGLFAQGTVTGQVLFSEPSVQEAIDPSLIVDGLIDGKTITGATIRTAAAGARVELTKTGMKGYTSTGAVYMDASNGTLDVTGTVQSTFRPPSGAELITKLGITQNLANGATAAPGVEFGVNYPANGTPTGYMPARITSGFGTDLEVSSGTPGGTSDATIGRSSMVLENGNAVFSFDNDTQGKGLHSTGQFTTNYDGHPHRIPMGMLFLWENSTAVACNNETQIQGQTILVPAYATIRITVALRGASNTNNTYVNIRCYASNALVNEQMIFAAGAWNTHGGNFTFFYNNTTAQDRDVPFRITGQTILPSTAIYTIPARSTTIGPGATVAYEDIGSVYNASANPYVAVRK